MVRLETFENLGTVDGDRVRLDVMTSAHLDGVWAMLHDPVGARLTGTHAEFTRDQVRDWVATRPLATDRADWAIVRTADDAFLGEAVLNDLDVDNASANFRISLAGPEHYGKGYGTEATGLAVDYAFDTAELHRVHLEVYAFNRRAVATYRRCGFSIEGRHRDALFWDGSWHDALSMAVLATDRTPHTDTV